MRIDEFNQMQQNLERMKNTLNDFPYHDEIRRNQKGIGKETAESQLNKSRHVRVKKIMKDERIIVITTILIVIVTFVFSSSIFAQTISENTTENQVAASETNVAVSEENTENQEFVAEKNNDAIELEEILLENVSVLKSKEFVEEIRPIEFETTYHKNANLPEGEEVVLQQGVNGQQQVTVIKSYENDVFVSENILESKKIEDSVSEVVDLGTSKFLAEKKIHIGDKLYAKEEVILRESADENSNEVKKVPQSMDVKLQELKGEDWCKVTYKKKEGYVQTKYLTSKAETPTIVEANRIQKIKLTVKEDMLLNKSTKLKLEDYKKMLSNNPLDKNKIIEDNAEVFYNMDKKYNMNGVFLASMAIHESAWGTSKIAQDKKNLFGYGAYDSSPYQSSFSFDTYGEGIELVAKVLVKYYLNEQGTAIYDGEVAKGSYYNGATTAGVNIRYASDTEWHNKIYKYMQYLYDRL